MKLNKQLSRRRFLAMTGQGIGYSALAAAVTAVSPTYPDLSGAARLAAETPRQIANAHTFFNVANTLIFIWFTGVIARFVERLIPDRPLEDEGVIVRPLTPFGMQDAVRITVGTKEETDTLIASLRTLQASAV